MKDFKIVIIDGYSGKLIRYAESESEAIRWSLDNLFDSNKPVKISLDYDLIIYDYDLMLPIVGIIELRGIDSNGLARWFDLVPLYSIATKG